MNSEALNLAFARLRYGHYREAWKTYEREWGPLGHRKTMLCHGDDVSGKTVYLYN